MDITWEDCTLRKWMNGKFYQDAFNEDEKKLILKSVLENKAIKSYNRADGNNTEDNVFLLSVEEAEKYFGHRMGDNALNRVLGRPDGEIEHWFLRNPGNAINTAAYVNDYGCADPDEGPNISVAEVRPAIWISIE